MNNRVRWHLSALASAIALLGSLASPEAHALGLGRISVQSALGEALKAEIDIVEISADEASSLKVGIASAEAFKTAGLEHTAAAVGLQISLQKRPDGRTYLRLSSTRPVTEPFVDLILEANWASGRIVRDYTMLIDPPGARLSGSAAAPATPTVPILSRSETPATPSAAGSSNAPYFSSSSPPVRTAPVAKTQPSQVSPAPKAQISGQQFAVKPGDTASKIAAQNKPASISLDQMLVALLRSNPDAFIGGNINRIKSGVVLDIPGADKAANLTPGEASRTILAQAKDFNDFRRKLAENVPATQVNSANRQAGGLVQAKVEDRAPTPATPDKLTLSKGAVQGKTAVEDKIVKDREAREALDRVAELTKNIGALNSLAGTPASVAAASPANRAGLVVAKVEALPAPAASAAAPATAAAGIAKPAVAAPTTATIIPVVAVLPATTITQAVAASTSPAMTASAPVALARPPAIAARPPPTERALIDQLTENVYLPPLFGALLLLLAGLGFYRYKRRNNATLVDSSFLESRLQPDSFFGASGGQRVDTNEGGITGSSLMYSPSQLDGSGDVDPVAEADVYLAYGRDLQAEEILKEALRTHPTRVSVHAKLMEIYFKRRDVKGFEVIAVEALKLTHGKGPEWLHIVEMGRHLDPANPMYQAGGQPQSVNLGEVSQTPAIATAFDVDTIPLTTAQDHEAPSTAVDVDLDLNFAPGDEPVVPHVRSSSPLPLDQAPAAAPSRQDGPTMVTHALPEFVFDALDMDLTLDTKALKPTVEAPMTGGMSFSDQPPVVAKSPPALVIAAPDSGMLEFDLGSLSLDLDGPLTESPTIVKPVATSENRLETKFALAEEFRALGDTDGARLLADEVVAKAKGSLKSKAQAFLNALS